MKYPKIHLAQTVIALCKTKGIEHIVISPGSRNAPLTIGFTEDPFFSCYSIVDERCAAFFALGIAQQTKKPAAVVCTSGSALLNYYPAVSEAFYSDIPLIVLSADRPKHRIDIGDGQTIRQDDVFNRHIIQAKNLEQDINHATLEVLSKEKHQLPKFIDAKRIDELQAQIQERNEHAINTVLNSAIAQSGPVHLNIPFEEPLYETLDAPSVFPKNVSLSASAPKFQSNMLDPFIKKWNAAKRKMILVGVLGPNTIEQKFIERLAEDDSVIVLTESTSNLHHREFFPTIDKIIAPMEKLKAPETAFEQLRPEILLTFGGMVVSKKIKAFLRKFQPKHHWHIDEKKAYDTFFCLEKHFLTSPNHFFGAFLDRTSAIESDYKSFWQQVKSRRNKCHDEYLKNIPFSDLVVFKELLSSIPDDMTLQLSNSSTIRYVQLFDQNPTIAHFCNRGTSGIDGSTSTAIGSALTLKSPTLLVTGDLSFFYDSNALWNGYIRNDFRIILINNQGGGIFRILPGDKDSDNFDSYFETVHTLNAENLAKMYNFEYQDVKSASGLSESLRTFFESSQRPKLLEVFTPRTINDSTLIGYFEHLIENEQV
ncbi:2-succinyl-5-enolpyruvyl-6-hydroxy-3-cyclohexene-1-carboxylate synthase [Sungkyunkwania multivorans]|uniref:2-succinyl-5-enolpyruvyl-6-hydroxy-3-cyclohexene-1-carboxylate synthase n=1 Tax=Sungkyunkwania multivorans TaxID=1173618 RepID=A0ABW3CYT2_9FLAO